MIRGKGATKQGKYNPLGLPQPGEDEELHALITAASPEDLKVGMDKVLPQGGEEGEGKVERGEGREGKGVLPQGEGRGEGM